MTGAYSAPSAPPAQARVAPQRTTLATGQGRPISQGAPADRTLPSLTQPPAQYSSEGGPQPSISGTTQSPDILAGIQDLFIPADSPFTAGLFGTGAGTTSEGAGGFGPDTGTAGNSQLPVATNSPFPLFYAQSLNEENSQSDDKVLRRTFGACSAGGGQ